MPTTDVTAPNGEVIPVNHPEGASREQILGFAKMHFDSQLDEGEKRERMNLMKYMSEAPERFEQTKQRYAEALTTDQYDPTARTGQLDPMLRASALLGTAAETATGVGGEAYRRYAPEPVQEFVSDLYEGSALEKGVEYVGELASEYPLEATALEAASNVAMVGPNVGIKGPRVPRKVVTDAKTRASIAKRQEELDNIAKTLTPEDPTKAAGGFEVKGPLNSNVYVPSPTENDVITYLHTLDAYPASKNPVENYNYVNESIDKLERELQEHVSKSKNPKVNFDDFSDDLLDSVEDFYGDKDYRSISPAAQKQVDTFLEQTLELLADRSKKGNITARDILEIRRDLDKQIFNNSPSSYIENPDVSSARDVAGRFVRTQLNEQFLDMLPTDVAYQKLNGMSMLFKAKNLLRTKAGKSVGSNAISRAKSTVEDIIGLQFPSTPLALLATVGAGGSMLMGSPVVAGILGGSALGYGIARLSRPKQRAAVLRDLLRTTDGLLKGANVTADQVRKLRADKIMLSQMLSQTDEEAQNDE